MWRWCTFTFLASSICAAAVRAPKVEVIGHRAPSFLEGGVEQALIRSSLKETLRRLSSVDLRTSGGEGSEPLVSIRGQDPIQNRYFLEGIPLNDGEFQSASLSSLPLEGVSRIEVFPSAAPVSLTTDGLGGAIDFSLNATSAPSRVGGKWGTFGFAEGQASVSGETFRVVLRGIRSNEDFTYLNDNGTPLNLEDDRLERREHNHFYRVNLLPYFSTSKLTGFSLQSFSETQVPGQVSNPSRANLSQYHQLTALSLREKLSSKSGLKSSVWLRANWDRLSDPENSLVTNYRFQSSMGESVGARGVFSHQLDSHFGLEGALSGGWDGFQNPGDQHERWQGTGAASGKTEFGGYKTQSEILFGFYRYPTGSNFSGLSPRLGFSVGDETTFRLRAMLGSYFRMPAMSEIYGTPFGVSPNPNLVPEYADKMEAGMDWVWKEVLFLRRIRGAATVSFSDSRNLITYINQSLWESVAQNIGKSQIASAELRLEGNLPSGFGLFSSFTFLRGVNLSEVSFWNGRELPGFSPYRLEEGVSWKRWGFGVEYRLSVWGPRFEDLANLKQKGAVAEHGIAGSFQRKGWGEFQLEIQNLTDSLQVGGRIGAFQTVENSFGLRDFPAPGRRISLSWRSEI